MLSLEGRHDWKDEDGRGRFSGALGVDASWSLVYVCMYVCVRVCVGRVCV